MCTRAALVLGLACLAGRSAPAGQSCEVAVEVRDFRGGRTMTAQVIFGSPEGKKIAEGKTDREGVFRTTLDTGHYELQVFTMGFRRYEQKVDVACEAGHAQEIHVRLEVGETR